ncbi:MAG: DUF2249 domain-containing protein [Gammaproteobacteria bacterium]|nr:DUF2249 domain-containing protein [Gammaproteobacteria bacterium]
MSRVMDVRTIPHAIRHQTIFEAWEGLKEGESFLLVADHDPVPLRRQFEAMHGEKFSWTYARRGPDTWRVEIGRREAA